MTTYTVGSEGVNEYLLVDVDTDDLTIKIEVSNSPDAFESKSIVLDATNFDAGTFGDIAELLEKLHLARIAIECEEDEEEEEF